MPRLILLRHGQSQWNLENRFTGWVDVDLTAEGEAQARRAGDLIARAAFRPAVMFTSVLTRAKRTGALALQEAGLTGVPVIEDWRRRNIIAAAPNPDLIRAVQSRGLGLV